MRHRRRAHFRSRLRHRYGHATLASAGTFARPGQIVRYVGWTPHLAGMEGRIVTPAGSPDQPGESPHEALIQWATHERAIRQKGSTAHWYNEWIPHEDLKPIRKLTKGFSFYRPDTYEGHRIWVKE